MSICQNESASCTACCGSLNLVLDSAALLELFDERSRSFAQIDLKDHMALVAWRHGRESVEEKVKRRDPHVYVCPFVGWLNAKRPGCLIHPERTGNPRSQNASFYGAGICLAYDCRAKERDGGQYATAIASVCRGDAILYSRLAGDALFFRLFEILVNRRSMWPEREPHGERPVPVDPMLPALMKLRLRANAHPASFELPGMSQPAAEDLLRVLFPGNLRVEAAAILESRPMARPAMNGCAPGPIPGDESIDGTD